MLPNDDDDVSYPDRADGDELFPRRRRLSPTEAREQVGGMLFWWCWLFALIGTFAIAAAWSQ